MEIKVLKSVLDAHESKAKAVRRLLNQHQILMLNLISSPGSGKTTLLEKTLAKFKDDLPLAVIEGDVATAKDALRLNRYGCPIILINTEGGCHLNSLEIEDALGELALDSLDLVFVENVGNLVCPAEFDLGEQGKIAMVSTTEGDDKPSKYPLLFRSAELVLLNKMDLISHTNFNKAQFYEDLHKINGTVRVIETSCVHEQGLDQWFAWIKNKVSDIKNNLQKEES